MPKRLLLIFALVLVLFGVGLVWLLNPSEGGTRSSSAYYSDNWDVRYGINDSAPRGLRILGELVEFRTGNLIRPLYDSLTPASLKGSNKTFLFVGDEFHLKQDELDTLLNLVNEGANLFLASNAFSDRVYEYFFRPSQMQWQFSQRINVQFYTDAKTYPLHGVYQQDTVALKWNFFRPDSIRFDMDDRIETVEYLCHANGYVNFLSVHLGKGHVFLHSNPELFQNYQLLSKNGYDYMNKVLENIPEKHQVYWLELGRVNRFELVDSPSGNEEGNGLEEDNSLLKLIYEHKALMFAFLLTLLGIILYLLFRTKRNQPIIPYLARTDNHTLSFADTLKEIYYRQQTPHAILQVMRRNLYQAINKQFFVDISKEDREREMQTLAEKSGIPGEELKKILRHFEINSSLLVDYPYLQKAAEIQRDFYLRTGIIKEKVLKRVAAKTIRIQRRMLLAVLFIFSGILSILIGFYLLFAKMGAGILLWPVGMALLTVGIRMFSTPVIKIQGEMLTIYALFGRKKKYPLSRITHIRVENGLTSISTDDGLTHTINNNDISPFSWAAFEQFVSPYVNQQL